MVKKKVLKAQIDFLLQRIEELNTTIRYNEKDLEYLNSHFKELQELFDKLKEENIDLKAKNEQIEEKIDFLFRQSAIKAQEENDSLFNEWMNGAKKEGEN
jgi:uncharacterized protein (DUF3084 family)